jgi:hypothetical protein
MSDMSFKCAIEIATKRCQFCTKFFRNKSQQLQLLNHGNQVIQQNEYSIVLVRGCEYPIDLIFSVLKREPNPTDDQITSFLLVIKICWRQ